MCHLKVLIACLAAVSLCAPASRAADLKAGAATIDITPPVGYPMWGYAARRDKPSQGILDKLSARALVLRVGNEKLALVSLDLGRAPTRQSFASIRKALQKQIGLFKILLVASHTHHGPVLEIDTWPTKQKSYVRQLEKKIVDVIVQAHGRLQTARYGIAAKEVSFNRNRHSRRRPAPVDRELIVMRFENAHGKPVAHLVNFAAHPTMHPARIRKFSADYPGVMARNVEKATGVPCLFLQGAAGDLSANAGALKGPTAFGQRLGQEVLAILKAMRCHAGTNSKLTVREREFRFRMRFDLSNPLIKTAFSLAFFPELIEFYEREYRDGVRPRMTTVLLDGKIGFVGVSGEVFCGHALSLKRRARLEHLLFFGYCNDYHQYIPTIEAVAEGGYGADMQVAPIEVGAGEKMMNRALIDLYQMRGRILELKKPK